MNWKYLNSEIETISDFPDNTMGFVYKLTHTPTGKSYIGKKVLQFTRKVKLGKKELAELVGVVGRRPSYKLAVKESDWLTYYGSNKVLLELLKKDPIENFSRHIIKFATTKKLLTYYETQYQFMYQVLEKPDMFFNDNILGKFFKKDFDPR